MTMVTLRGSLKAKRLSSSERRRMQQRAMVEASHAVRLLLAVLAQVGGSITVTTGTLSQVMSNYDNLGFEIAPSTKVEGEFQIRLLSGAQPAASEPTSVIDLPARPVIQPIVGV